MQTSPFEQIVILYQQQLVPSTSLENDGSYRKYTRRIRIYRAVTRHEYNCCICSQVINKKELCETHVFVSKPRIFSEQMGKRVVFFEEKKHYPKCPGSHEELETESLRQWEERERNRMLMKKAA